MLNCNSKCRPRQVSRSSSRKSLNRRSPTKRNNVFRLWRHNLLGLARPCVIILVHRRFDQRWEAVMAQSKKLSGADLAAQLGVLPAFSGPQTTASVEAEPARRETPDAAGAGLSSPNVTTQEVSPPALSGSTQSKRPQGGRPSKAGVDGIPLNVRLSQGDHLALARLAGDLLVPGKPMPTVQDVVRGLIRGALQEPDAALRLVRQADMS